MRVAILGAAMPACPIVMQLLAGPPWCAARCVPRGPGGYASSLDRFDVAVVIDAPADDGPPHEVVFQRRLEELHARRMPAVVLSPRPAPAAVDTDVPVVYLPIDVRPDTLRDTLRALGQIQPAIRKLESELAGMRQVGQRIGRYLEELDHELRLASRLQRDFLPREIPRLEPLRFHTLFRPCSWVSGDIFDVFRLDETHMGLYLADAMGHGVAAGLLTMFIKNAIRPKRIFERGYELVPPAEVLSKLNDQLVAQNLPDSQFVTGWYGTIDVNTLELRYAVAGHPPPLHVAADGTISELHADGCLLGVFGNLNYVAASRTLRPGDRVLLFSDGLEPALIADRRPLPTLPEFQPGIVESLRLPADALSDLLRNRLDTMPGSLMHADDASLVILDVSPDSPS